jgi:hypothetical protein
MSTPLPPAQHGAVPAGIKATPSGWPPASLDPGCGRRTPAATGSPAQGENPTNSGLYGFRGLPGVRHVQLMIIGYTGARDLARSRS